MTAPTTIHLAGPLAGLSGLVAAQHGCFTRAQAAAAGLSNRQLRQRQAAGEVREVHADVFALAGAAPSFLADCSAAVLSLPGSVIADRAAARLHGLDGFGTAPVELLVPHGGPNRRAGVELRRTKRWLPGEVDRPSGIPATSLAWTLARLGAVVDDRHLEDALDEALRRGLGEAALRSVLATLHRRPAAVRLQRMLDRPGRMAPPTDGWFERLVERALAAPGLPAPQRQHRVVVRGRVVARLELAYPVVKVGVEAQSRAQHTAPADRTRDRLRISRLADAGWEIVEWWWDDLADAAEAVALVRAACRRQARRLGVDPHLWLPLPAAG